MSEIGNEATSAVFNLAGKGIEATSKLIMAFLKYLLGHQERKATKLSNKLKEAQIKDLKNSEYRKDAVEYLNTKKGIQDLKVLLSSGDKVIPLGQTLNKKDFKRFSKLADLYGVNFSANKDNANKEKIKKLKKDIKEFEKDLSEEAKQKIAENEAEIENLESQKEQYIIFVRAKDLERVKAITDRMNMELKIDAINLELNDIEKEGGDKEREEKLHKAKEEIINERFDNANKVNNEKIMEDNYNDMNFEDVVNDFTDLGTDVPPYVICDRTNPNNYMVATSREAVYEGRVHTDTNFEVFKDGERQTCTLYEKQHGEFSFRHDKDGNPTTKAGADNWAKLKKEMKIKGGFSDNVVVFSSVLEYEKYKENFNKVKDKLKVEVKEITNEDGKSYKDYAGATKQLKEQKEACCDEVEKDGSITFIPKNEIAGKQAKLIDMQIEKYEKLNATQNKLALAYEMKEDSAENTSDIDKKIEQLEKEIEILEKEVNNMQMKKESIASVEVLEDITNDRENEKENTRENTKENSERVDENTHREDENTQTKEQWEQDMADNHDKGSNNDFGKNNSKDKGGKNSNDSKDNVGRE